jgi:RNA polymerase sigma-70 factor (ECF subfamily)
LTREPFQEFIDPDADLLRLVMGSPEGDLRAFEELVKRYQGRILADCRFLTRDENNAEDLAQEVFVKAFFALRTFEGRSAFRSWLQRIKVNHCLNHMKKRQGRGDVALDEDNADSFSETWIPADAERKLERAASQQRIDAILSVMPPTLRVPLVMRDMDELSYEEIAASLGLGLSAVKMRIKRGREFFRRRYEGEDVSSQEGGVTA